MKIVIIGDGKMGFALSQKLSDEGHDIVIIDENPDMLRLSSNTQDVGCICGNGVNIDVQKEAGVPTADLMIAVTSRDEVNIICCLLAKKLGARHTTGTQSTAADGEVGLAHPSPVLWAIPVACVWEKPASAWPVACIPPSAPWLGAVCAGSSRSGTCQPRLHSASAPGRCSV